MRAIEYVCAKRIVCHPAAKCRIQQILLFDGGGRVCVCVCVWISVYVPPLVHACWTKPGEPGIDRGVVGYAS